MCFPAKLFDVLVDYVMMIKGLVDIHVFQVLVGSY